MTVKYFQKDDFKPYYDDLLKILGGNPDDLTCDGKPADEALKGL